MNITFITSYYLNMKGGIKIMRKIICLSLIFVILLSISASAREISVYINGKKLFFDVPPTQIEGRTMVPLRAIFEGLGAFVEYNNFTRTITANKGNKKIQLTLDSQVAYVNGQTKYLDVPAMSLRGSTMVPLRFVGEAFDAKVKWESSQQAIFIETQDIATATSGPGTGATTIYSIYHDAAGNLNSGDVITVTLIGTPGSKAYFDIAGIVSGVGVNEMNSGKYVGTYTIKSTDRGKDLPVTGYLMKDNSSSSRLEADKRITVGQGSVQQTSGEEIKIYSFTHNGNKPLKKDEELRVILKGTPGGKATFDISNFKSGLLMYEVQSGVYEGIYKVSQGDIVTEAVVVGHLSKDGKEVGAVQSGTPLNITGIGPKISAVSPSDRASVESDRPNIYITFDTQNSTLINLQSVKLIVNGVDVSSQTSKTTKFVTYNPANPLPVNRNIPVEFSARDDYGNVISLQWSFTINPASNSIITSAYHNGQYPLKAGQRLDVTVFGKSKCTGWIEISGLNINNIALSEIEQGKYVGSYTINSSDKISNARVTVHLGDQNKSSSLVVEPPVTFDVEQGFNAPQILNITDGQQVSFPLVIEGYTKPFATVTIKYDYATSLFGLPLLVQGSAGTKKLSADDKGHFYDTYTSTFSSGTKHTITVNATDSNGNASPSTIIKVTQN